MTPNEHFPGRERDEKAVLGYYVAPEKAKTLAEARGIMTETDIRLLHGLVIAGGRTKVIIAERFGAFIDEQNRSVPPSDRSRKPA